MIRPSAHTDLPKQGGMTTHRSPRLRALAAILMLAVSACSDGAALPPKASPPTPASDEPPYPFPKAPTAFELQDRIDEVKAAYQVLVELIAQSPPKIPPTLFEKLKRNSGITLQWLGDDVPRGHVTITKTADGRVKLQGEQRDFDSNDYIILTGEVVGMTPTAFVLLGTLDMDVQSLREDGSPRCLRTGAFTFRATEGRKYWRLLEKDRYCGTTTDYVDIYF